MGKKVLVVICMLVLTIIGLLYVDFVCADDYIDLEDVPVEEIIIYPGFNSSGLPLVIESDDIEVLKELQKECRVKMNAAHAMAEAARALGYAEDHPVIVLAGQEWTAWYTNWKNYDEQIKNLMSVKIEYPVAHAVWVAFKEKGYTNESIAAILGNMMKECGGHTLALNYKAYNSNGGYYGLCQWSKKYYPEVLNSSLEFQIEWLLKTIMPDFYKETNIENATIRFAREYERCSSFSYDKRIELAKIAYNYFVENFE